jgi:hypothetical protein
MNSPELPDFTKMTRRQIEDYLVERSIMEPEFRKALVEQPRETLKALGLPVGPDVEIGVIAEKPKSFFIVLPHPMHGLQELDETELDDMRGGLSVQPDPHRFFKGYS